MMSGLCWFFWIIGIINCVSTEHIAITKRPSKEIWNVESADSKLVCTASSREMKKIIWIKNNWKLDLISTRIKQVDSFLNSHSISCLNFQTLLKSDEGRYKCMFLNSFGEYTTSHAVTVTIQGHPLITNWPKNMKNFIHNKSLGMTCSTKVSLQVTHVIWKYSMYSGDFLLYSNSVLTTKGNPNFHLNELPEIDAATKKGATSYRIHCIAYNAKGSTSSSFAFVYLQQTPGRPCVTGVTSNATSANVTWENPFSGVNFCQMRLTSYDTVTILSNSRDVESSFILELKNLKPSTSYEIAIRCKNKTTFSAWSSLYLFETTPSKLKRMRRNVSLVMDDTNKQIKNLLANTTNDEVPGQPKITKVEPRINGAKIHFKSFNIGNTTIDNCTFNIDGFGTYPKLHFSETKFTENLQFYVISSDNIPKCIKLFCPCPQYTLNVSVSCSNNKGKSPSSDIVNITTQRPVLSDPPKYVSIKVYNDSCYNISWLPPFCNFFSHYQVILTPSCHQERSISQNIPYPNNSTVVCVSPQIGYSVTVRACLQMSCTKYSVGQQILLNSRDCQRSTANPFSKVVNNTSVNDTQVQSSHLPVLIVIPAVIVVIALIALYRYFYAKRSDSSPISVHRGAVPDNNGTMRTLNLYYTPMSPLGSISMHEFFADKLEGVLIEKKRLSIGKVLGEGEFGFVYKGQLTIDECGSLSKQDVAIKSIKMDDRTMNEKEEFIEEGLRMRDLNHPNVMHLLGVCLSDHFNSGRSNSSDVSPLVVLPFMENGDLRTYLFTCRSSGYSKRFTVAKLLQFGLDIAKGMQYLSARNFIHRDLAARNCMLGQNFNVVVSDFGLSRKLYAENYYRQKHITKLPVKWMAMESLGDNIFNTITDVWSFGVTMWEILTLCQTPYPGVANHEVYPLLRRGTRLNKPLSCSSELWHRVVYPCWIAQASARITFDQLVEHLTQYINTPSEDLLQPLNEESANISSTGGYEEPISIPVNDYKLADDNFVQEESSTSQSLLRDVDNDSDSSSIVNL